VIVTMASTAGRQPSGANAAYAVAKAGVLMLTRHLAAEVGHHGVRLNSVAPSAVVNDKMRQAMSEDQLQHLGTSFPLGRLGIPTDVAEAVLYLVCADWVTGSVLDITGGRVIT
jgi:3-oxoacyl-[acyl-carrier protein] reductase